MTAWGRMKTTRTRRGRLERDRLPDPVIYYAGQGLKLAGHGSWRSACCPFHDDAHASMRINVETGRFCCFACDAKGDLVSYHMRRQGLDFVAACKDLGAWTE